MLADRTVGAVRWNESLSWAIVRYCSQHKIGCPMHLRFRLPGGTVKIKTRPFLRRAEINHEVPVVRIGRYFMIWWPAGKVESNR